MTTRKPPIAVRREAAKGLAERASSPPSKRCCEKTGIARARDLKNGRTISDSVVKRIVSFFARHSVDPKTPGSKSRQAWLMWGGDAGRQWAKREAQKIKSRQR